MLPRPQLKSSHGPLWKSSVAPDMVTSSGLHPSDMLQQKISESLCSRSLPTRKRIGSSGSRSADSSSLREGTPSCRFSQPVGIPVCPLLVCVALRAWHQEPSVSDVLILSVDPRAKDSVLGEHEPGVSHPGLPDFSQPLPGDRALPPLGTSESCVH